ncbi:MAG: carbamoyl phosphate synthase small subunit, partial [bacterium]
FMIENGIPGLTEVDTRSITLRVRTGGAVVGVIGGAEHSDAALAEMASTKRFSEGQGLVESVTGGFRIPSAAPHGDGLRAAVIDFGVKASIVAALRALGVEVTVIATGRAGDGGFDVDSIIRGDFDFVVLSNGPGDPADVPAAVASVRTLIGRIPILGICLGHQIAALALGGSTFKMKFGHRGANHPVACHRTGRVFVTSQNHGYAVGGGLIELGGDVEITYSNLNDGTVEGFRSSERLIECVQFHPEASPGPHDTAFIFSEFCARVRGPELALPAGQADTAAGKKVEHVQPV